MAGTQYWSSRRSEFHRERLRREDALGAREAAQSRREAEKEAAGDARRMAREMKLEELREAGALRRQALQVEGQRGLVGMQETGATQREAMRGRFGREEAEMRLGPERERLGMERERLGMESRRQQAEYGPFGFREREVAGSESQRELEAKRLGLESRFRAMQGFHYAPYETATEKGTQVFREGQLLGVYTGGLPAASAPGAGAQRFTDQDREDMVGMARLAEPDLARRREAILPPGETGTPPWASGRGMERPEPERPGAGKEAVPLSQKLIELETMDPAKFDKEKWFKSLSSDERRELSAILKFIQRQKEAR